ncbi:MAG: hypothetical protein J0L82_09815 [Deltaproteobacteria bacterium]|jgi:hypothetical protein|nr:hypothetical protein [Deltaproteobacteria bacterium]
MSNILSIFSSLLVLASFSLLGCGREQNDSSLEQDARLKPSIAALSPCNLDRKIEAVEMNESMKRQEISVQEIPSGIYRFSKTWLLWRNDETYLHYVDEMSANTLGGFVLERTYDCGGGFPMGQYRVDVSINGLSDIEVFNDGSVNFKPRGIGFRYDSSQDRIGSASVDGIPTRYPGFGQNVDYSAWGNPSSKYNLSDVFPFETVKLYRMSKNRFQVRTESIVGNQKVNSVSNFESTSVY